MVATRSNKWRDEVLDFLLQLEGTYAERATILTEKFGETYLPNQVRMAQKNILPFYGKGSGYAAPPKPQELTPQERIAAAVEKLTGKQTKLIMDRDTERQAFSEMLLSVLATYIEPLKFTMPVPRRVKSVSGEEQAVLVLGDWHFGKLTPSYSMAVACETFSRAIDKTLEIVNLHRKMYAINKIHVFWLGDIVDGDAIYPTHTHHLDAPVVGQVFGSAPHIVSQLARLAGEFNEVECHCIYGNHGRVSRYHDENDNWDIVLYRTLETASSQIPNLKWNIGEWHMTVDVDGLGFLLVHGDQVRIYTTIPMYKMLIMLARWALTANMGPFDVMACGHFHTSADLDWGDKTILMNGSPVSGDDYALRVIGLTSQERQWLLGVKEGSVTWQYKLNLRGEE